MPIAAEILDFMQFAPQRVRDLEAGDIYIYDGALFLFSKVNDHPIYTLLTDLDMGEFDLNDRPIARLTRGLSVKLKPAGSPEAVEPNSNIHGWAVPYGAGIGLCASLGAPQNPGRIVVPLTPGPAEFHNRELSFGFPYWRIEWLNKHREPVFEMTRVQ